MGEIPENFQEQELNHENNTGCSPNGFPGVPHVRGHESAAQRYTATRLQAGFPDRWVEVHKVTEILLGLDNWDLSNTYTSEPVSFF